MKTRPIRGTIWKLHRYTDLLENTLPSLKDTTYIDDLPLDDVVDEEEQTDEESAIPVEECLANKDKLPMDTVQRMLRQRTRLSQLIRLVNRRQNMFCRPDHQKDEVEYRCVECMD